MRNLQKLLSIFIAISILTTSLSAVYAADLKIFVSVGGKKISTTTSGLKTAKGFLAAAKLIATKMGLKYSYVSATKKISFSKGTKKVVFTLNKVAASSANKTLICKVAPKLVGTSVYVDPSILVGVFGYRYMKYISNLKTLAIAQNTATPVPTPSAKPTAKPTPTPSAKPTATPTASPTPTPELPTPVKNSMIRIFIVTENSEEIKPTSPAQKISATVTIDDGKSAPTVTLSKTKIVLEGRGNSTFWEIPTAFPKYPMKFKFTKDRQISVCGMPPANNWNLLANLYDKTLLRNACALNFGAKLSGLQWTPKSQIVEVYLNGRYHGVYLLTEDIEISPSRLNLDATGDNLGFLLEWDMRAKKEAEKEYAALPDKTGHSPLDYYFLLSQLGTGITFAYKSPKGDLLTQTQRNFIKKTISDVSNLIVSPANDAYVSKVNLNSFVDYFIVNDFFHNNDSVSFSSIYLFQGKAGKLNMGPIWDYDLYIGNNGNDPASKCLVYGSPWFSKLATLSPAFKAALKTRWAIAKPLVQSAVIAYLDAWNIKIQDAQTRNYTLWQTINYKFNFPNNSTPLGSYAAEVTFLKYWLTQRIAYADGYYSKG